MGYAHKGLAQAGTWIASGLLLVCIIIYVKEHKAGNKE